MRILHVVPELGYGGVEKVVRNYYEHIDHEKYHFDYVTHGNEEDYHKEIIQEGSAIYYFRTIGKVGLRGYRRQIKAQIDLEEYDIIHIHIGYLTGVYAYVFRRCGARSIIVHAHTTKVTNSKHRFLMPLLRTMTAVFSDVRIACGQEAGIFCFGGHSFLYLPNGINFELFEKVADSEVKTLKNELGISQSEFVIGHVGRFTEQKNHIFLVSIIHEYLKIDDKVKIILVGDGPYKELIAKLISENGDADKVVFAGVRDSIEMYMKMFDLFALPSLFEGLPVVSIEAQAAGTPCLISNKIDKTLDLGLGLVSFLSIDNGCKEWISAITSIKNNVDSRVSNEKIYEALIKQGYEVSSSAKKLSEIYDSLDER